MIELRDVNPAEIKSIETSVLWMTEGKGDSDIGVHFFERREKKDVSPELLKRTYKLNTLLPQSPLSYDGSIVKIIWLIRVRIFMEDGSEKTHDEPFRLGQVSMLNTPALAVVSDEGEEKE